MFCSCLHDDLNEPYNAYSIRVVPNWDVNIHLTIFPPRVKFEPFTAKVDLDYLRGTRPFS